MRHLSNTYDPKREDAKRYQAYSYDAWHDAALRDREWQSHLRWINEHIIGPPVATDAYTVEELEAMGYIGVYAEGEAS